VDFTTPANSKFTGPVTIAVAPYTPGSRDMLVAIPQPGTSELLDVNGKRSDAPPGVPQLRRGQPSARVSGCHTVGDRRTGASSRTAVRWYELRSPGTTPRSTSKGTYSPNTTNRWMGSIAMT